MAYQFGPAHSFKQDVLEIGRADLAAGRLQRRDFLKLCLWAGGTTSLAWLNGHKQSFRKSRRCSRPAAKSARPISSTSCLRLCAGPNW